MGCVDCGHHGSCIRNFPLFITLSPQEIEQISTLISHATYPRKSIILSENDSLDRLLIVQSGKLKAIRYGIDGEEIVVDILSSGDLYGSGSLLSPSVSSETLVAMDDSMVCHIQSCDIRDLIMAKPQIGLKLIEVLNITVNHQKLMLEIISLKDTDKKLAMFLLEHSRRLKTPDITMTQEDIANSVRLTKETVNRKLKDFREKGLIALPGHKHLHILDRRGLEQILYQDRKNDKS